MSIISSVRRYLSPIKRKIQLIGLFEEQYLNFEKFAALSYPKTQDQITTKMIFYVHQIEKGLSHSVFRPRFGEVPLENIAKLLLVCKQRGMGLESDAMKMAFSILRQYELKHDSLGEPLPRYFGSLFDGYSAEISAADLSLTGTHKFVSETQRDKDFSAVITSRASIREYAKSSVCIDTIKNAIDIATHSPSVCNRQPARIHVFNNRELIEKILQIQGGWKGYDAPPSLLLVTSQLSSFVNEVERNEPYVDGGIFSMTLLGALHYYNLCACPLNTMFSKKQEHKIAEITGIKDDEVMIMFVAVGNPPEEILHPCSLRMPADEIMMIAE